MRSIRASLSALLVFCAAIHTARSDWLLATSAALNHDNNVGNAENAASVVADSRAEAKLSLLQQLPLGDGFSLSADGDHVAALLTGRSVGGDELWIAEHWIVRENKLWRMMNFYHDTRPLVGDRSRR